MGAEALCTLGRSEMVIPRVERYRLWLEEHPQARNPISSDRWREALGDIGRVGDWTEFFDHELEDAPWRNVLGKWTPPPAAGFVAATTHGAIRTGHTVRSIAVADAPLRRDEMAEGLANTATAGDGPFPQVPGSTELLRDPRAPRTVPKLAWIRAVTPAEHPLTVVRDSSGDVVSVCHSARATGRAAEAGVETAPEYRGRGFAAAVVLAWAAAVLAEGRLPLYSTQWTNLASRGVARGLGLIQYGEDYHCP